MIGTLRWYVRTANAELMSYFFDRMENFGFHLRHPVLNTTIMSTSQGRVEVEAPSVAHLMVGGSPEQAPTVQLWRDADTDVMVSMYPGPLPVLELDLDGLSAGQAFHVTGALLLIASCRLESLAVVGDPDLENLSELWDQSISDEESRRLPAPALLWRRENSSTSSLGIASDSWFFAL